MARDEPLRDVALAGAHGEDCPNTSTTAPAALSLPNVRAIASTRSLNYARAGPVRLTFKLPGGSAPFVAGVLSFIVVALLQVENVWLAGAVVVLACGASEASSAGSQIVAISPSSPETSRSFRDGVLEPGATGASSEQRAPPSHVSAANGRPAQATVTIFDEFPASATCARSGSSRRHPADRWLGGNLADGCRRGGASATSG